jgi:hypothetical protein
LSDKQFLVKTDRPRTGATTMLRRLQLALCLSSSAILNVATATDADTLLLVTWFDTVYPDHLERVGIDVYQDSNGDHTRYFVDPYLLPNWALFKAQLEERCADPQVRTSGTVKLRVPIELTSETLIEDIKNGRAAVANDGSHELDKLKTSAIATRPYGALMVTAGGLTGQPIEIYRWPDDWDGKAVAPRLGSGPSAIIATLSAPCDRLRDIYETADIHARIQTTVRELTGKAVHAEQAKSISHQITSSLFGEASQTGSISAVSNSSTGGFALKIPGLGGFGRGKSHVEIHHEDTRHRAVTEDVIYSALSNSRIDVLATCISTDGTPCTQADLDSVVDRIKQVADPIDVELRQRPDNDYDLVRGEVLGVLKRGDIKVSDSATHEVESNSSQKNSGSYGGASGSQEDAQKFASKNSVAVGQESKLDFVPTNVRLYMLDKDEVEAALNASFVSMNAGKSIDVPLPLNTIPPSELVPQIDLRVEEAVRRTEKADREKYEPIILPPTPKNVKFSNTPPGGFRSAWCASSVVPSDPDYSFFSSSARTADSSAAWIRVVWLGAPPAQPKKWFGDECVAAPTTKLQGCFVERAWLNWYVRHRAIAGEIPAFEDICSFKDK